MEPLLCRQLPADIGLEVDHTAQPFEVETDEVQFEQVIVNLAVSACGATPAALRVGPHGPLDLERGLGVGLRLQKRRSRGFPRLLSIRCGEGD